MPPSPTSGPASARTPVASPTAAAASNNPCHSGGGWLGSHSRQSFSMRRAPIPTPPVELDAIGRAAGKRCNDARTGFHLRERRAYGPAMNQQVFDPASKPDTPSRPEGTRAVKPRDAATLILVRREGRRPRVLLGRRHGG